MFLARIDGTLTASRKDDRLAGVRFLIGQRLDADGVPGGRAARGPRSHGRGPRLDRAGLVRRHHRARLARQGRARAPRRRGDRRPGGAAADACEESGVMRLGIVRGHVVLSRALPALQGTSLLLVEPVTAANLAARNGQGGGKTLVVADQLSPGDGRDDRRRRGQRGRAIRIPRPTPVDAYCALDRQRLTFQPPETSRPVGRGRTKMSALDLTALRVIAAKHIDSAASRGAKEILTRQGAVDHPAGRRRHAAARADRAPGRRPGGSVRRRRRRAPAGRPPASAAAEALFRSPEAERIKAEIVATGKKLWHRQYVDGNGGNISYRLGPNEVLCTPTLCSKYDLTPELICMVDLEGHQTRRHRPRARARSSSTSRSTRPCPRRRAWCTAIRRTRPPTPSRAACRPRASCPSSTCSSGPSRWRRTRRPAPSGSRTR